jgi:hypothetical protein
MPKFTQATLSQTVQTGGGQFKFSAVRPEKLGASEYTLVTIVVDLSSSVSSFRDDLLAAVKTAVRGCRQSPRPDNLLVRLLTFNTKRKEVHGFKPLAEIDPDGYRPFAPHGSTALFDAVYDAVLATTRYARLLADHGFTVNAAVYIVTDGCDNASTVGPRHIAEEIDDARRQELLESLLTVLIGINAGDREVQRALREFKDQAELSQYLDAGNATPDRLAQLAAFVSRSVGAQSRVLGTGRSATPLTF